MLHFFFEDIDQPWFLVIVELVLSNVIIFFCEDIQITIVCHF
jgi:hypothetical protein